jgi:hypothetical protein
MAEKTLKLEIFDPTGEVATTHSIKYYAGDGNRLRLTITDNTYIMDKNGKLVILTQKEINQEEQRKKPKIGDILYTDPKTGKTQTLFESLFPTFTVLCRNDNVVIGDKGCSVRITVAAENEEKAVLTALTKKAFTKHLRMTGFDMKCLSVYKPTGNYVIGQVIYHEGDERL